MCPPLAAPKGRWGSQSRSGRTGSARRTRLHPPPRRPSSCHTAKRHREAAWEVRQGRRVLHIRGPIAPALLTAGHQGLAHGLYAIVAMAVTYYPMHSKQRMVRCTGAAGCPSGATLQFGACICHPYNARRLPLPMQPHPNQQASSSNQGLRKESGMDQHALAAGQPTLY